LHKLSHLEASFNGFNTSSREKRELISRMINGEVEEIDLSSIKRNKWYLFYLITIYYPSFSKILTSTDNPKSRANSRKLDLAGSIPFRASPQRRKKGLCIISYNLRYYF
jgi:hypothetical protein